MTLYVQTIDSAGRPVAINPALVVGIEPCPATIVPASCYVRTSDAETFILPGSTAVVAALLESIDADILAQAKAYTDAKIAALRSPFTGPMNFLGNAAAVTRYINFSATTTPVGYSMPAGRLRHLTVHSWTNTLGTPEDCVFEVFKNQVTTGVTWTLLAADAPFVMRAVDCDIAWPEDAQLDVRGTLAAGSTSGALSTQISAYFSPP